MITAQLHQLEFSAARSLSLQFFLHEYAKALSIVSRLDQSLSAAILRDLQKISSDALQQPGILERLSSYCETFANAELLDELDHLRILVAKLRIQWSRSRSPHSFEELEHSLLRLFPLISQIIEENPSSIVLFTLLELSEPLNRHLGPGTIEALLEKLAPEGPQALRTRLNKDFSDRGFDQFIENHAALFEHIHWPLNRFPTV